MKTAVVSRFERRIIIAITVCAVAPFLISLIFIPQIIESRLAHSMHQEVGAQLERAAVFYKEFFDVKKSEFAARAEVISRDSVLIRSARRGHRRDLKARMEQILAENPDAAGLKVITKNGDTFVSVTNPEDRSKEDFLERTLIYPLGLGEAPLLETRFTLAKRYSNDRSRAEEIATLYQASMKTERSRAKSFYLGYTLINTVVVLLALAIGYIIARRVTKRIARLASATERVAKGELQFRVPIRGNDEITELSQRFNRMIVDLGSARDRIVYLEKISGWQEFARRLAHEIKNPLTPIRLSIQELRRRAPDDQPEFKNLVEDMTEVVDEEINALNRLVDEFSQFARLPAATPASMDIKAFVEDFLAAYNHFEPDAVIEVEADEGEILVSLDRVLMRRVFVNLLENAIESAGKGKAKVRLGYRALEHQVEIRVEDNGPGIEADRRDSVFEPYVTDKASGTGLGLAIVKKIVLQHGGSISVENSTLGGACFLMTLPRGDEREA